MYSSSSPLSTDDLDQAFSQGHFSAVFQPKLSLIDGRTLGVESFIRWHHPEFGTLLPGEFLSFVGAQGRLQDLTDLMLHEAARVVSIWRSQQRHWTVSVNLSAEDIDNPHLPHHICDLFTAYAIPSDAISVDVPEAALTEAPDSRLKALSELKKKGIAIALDTTGMDLLPLEKINAEYFSELKIGGTSLIKFARSISRSRKGLIAERLEAAAANGLSVTATRVEDINTIKPLADMGFSAAQGTFFRHPDTQEGLENWSSDWLLPVLSGERPPRADTIARARADLADPELLRLPEEDQKEIPEATSSTPTEENPETLQVALH
ncbi:EAL domain-containing protein [Parvibaculaceae bacterium PLY_AMNH_Bact1]|nr:EAL domain-containing protein [Parvibaculaceae bacterium PLY_AMNH_Bact1]